MKKIVALLASVFVAANVNAQLLLTQFDNSDLTSATGSFTFNIGPTNTTITGVDSNSITFTLASPKNITGFLESLSLTGSLNAGSTATSELNVLLFDQEGDYFSYGAFWTQFSGVQSTVTLSYIGSELSGNGSFDNIVTKIGFFTTGGGTGSINFTADTIVAVPEPSTYALLALGLGGVVLLRRLRFA